MENIEENMEKKLQALKKAIEMINGEFKDTISPEDFKMLMELPEIQKESRELFINPKVKNRNDAFAPNYEGKTIKIGGELVSLITRTDYKKEEGSQMLQPYVSKEDVRIDFNFEHFNVNIETGKTISPKGSISYESEPLQEFDKEKMKSFDTQTLIDLQTATEKTDTINSIEHSKEEIAQIDLQIEELEKQLEALKYMKATMLSEQGNKTNAMEKE